MDNLFKLPAICAGLGGWSFLRPIDISKMSKEELEAARTRAIETHRTLLVNLSACGLISPKAVATFDRCLATVRV